MVTPIPPVVAPVTGPGWVLLVPVPVESGAAWGALDANGLAVPLESESVQRFRFLWRAASHGRTYAQGRPVLACRGPRVLPV